MNQVDARIRRLIEDVINGQVDYAEFHKISKDLPAGASREAMDAWHTASHYLDDEDIRERDSEYASRQLDRLRWHVGALKHDKKSAAE